MRSVFALVLLVYIALADTATQTDWSGEQGIQGPVSDWSNGYWTSGSIDFAEGKLELSNGSIPPIAHTIEGDFGGAWSLYSADIDGDGDADVLGASWGADNITWWENTDGSGTSWTEHTVDGSFDGAVSVYSTDIDGDGDADVLGAANFADDITWWENTDGSGTSWTEHTIDGSFDGASSVYSTDIDSDGDADVLGASWGADNITWWENIDGSGTSWTEHTIDGSFYGASSVYSTDIDDDGDADVLGVASGDDSISWWENTDGTGTSWTEHLVGNLSGPTSVYHADIDGDGDTDVLGAGVPAIMTGLIYWWENTDGSGTSWTVHEVDGWFPGVRSVYSTDIDGDGDADVLGAAYDAEDITWWENTDGAGASWTEHLVDGDFIGPMSVYANDIDGDGDADILGAALGTENIAWWKISGYQPAGVIESSILDAGTVDSWELFGSNQQLSSGTSLGFQFRSSQDFANMGEWSDTVFSPDTPLVGILADFTRYLQYKVILETTDPSVSPELYEVTFSYTLFTGTEESESGEVLLWSLNALQNPSHGFFSALVSVPEAGSVQLFLYDVSGRVVGHTSKEFPIGTHSVSYTGLAEGVYFCTMHAGVFSATERIVVVE